ncbi:hypothetical protein G7Y89_g73 [Cudoniella acicularis]|uniref:Uncharacterized protein n=1 Tax=Cudoniella acicularis TaxID=354080 RepID=A0A8H4RXU4_9HELO|nr:hypothetical protein G7Y89_g73 [Cudoniella acicularis]
MMLAVAYSGSGVRIWQDFQQIELRFESASRIEGVVRTESRAVLFETHDKIWLGYLVIFLMLRTCQVSVGYKLQSIVGSAGGDEEEDEVQWSRKGKLNRS